VSRTDAAARVLDVVGHDGRGLRATFLWDEDRYGHEIACLDRRSVAVCLAAESGRERDPWPASPALQQLSVQDVKAGRRGVLLVGMAGTSHWSQTVEADAATTSLTFDVACRVQRQPQWLGSSYQTMHGDWGCPTPDGRSVTGACVELTVESATNSAPSRIEIDGGRFVIAPDLRMLRLPSTVRWKYRITLRAVTPLPSGEAD
jgi:hypothetical protein